MIHIATLVAISVQELRRLITNIQTTPPHFVVGLVDIRARSCSLSRCRESGAIVS